MILPFRPSPELTFGVEIEMQLVDADTRDLAPRSVEVLERLGPGQPHVKPEIFRSMLEIDTGVCHTLGEARRDLGDALRATIECARGLGMRVVGSGSHPFARYEQRQIYPAARYEQLLERNRWIAQRLSIFGVHVHVGMRDGDHCVAMIHGILHYLPHLLALSANSPYWQGLDTGLASSRVTVFEAMPTAGHPPPYRDWAGFCELYARLERSRAISSIKDLWWDVRPHTGYGTAEVRICDMPATLGEILALVGFTHALYADLDRRLRAGERIAPPAEWRIRENKWRASRHGLEALLVVDDDGGTEDLRAHLDATLDRLLRHEHDAERGAALRAVRAMTAAESGHARQRRVFQAHGSLRDVVDDLAELLEQDLAERSSGTAPR